MYIYFNFLLAWILLPRNSKHRWHDGYRHSKVQRCDKNWEAFLQKCVVIEFPKTFDPLHKNKNQPRPKGAQEAKLYTAISRKVVGKSACDNPERYCRWFWVQCSSKKFERMAREAMDECLQMLKKATIEDSTATVSGTVHLSYHI